ncbi:MAG: MFS transporter, partial [Actinomycetota bacterium]|nr:MFS transporter [Actinomycetota bacterium]
TTLLILRATDLLHRHGGSLDRAAAIAVLLYALHNAANALAAYPAGTLADRLGRRQVLVGGMVVFAISCLLFAITPASIVILAALFALVGVSRALVDTGQGSYAAELLPDNIRGRGFGLIGLVDALGDLVANVVVGVLFTVATPAAGFIFAAVMSSAGAATLLRRSAPSE